MNLQLPLYDCDSVLRNVFQGVGSTQSKLVTLLCKLKLLAASLRSTTSEVHSLLDTVY